VKAALRMARLSTVKTLQGFDFSFQPSLDRGHILAGKIHGGSRGFISAAG
jgi:hypothetical protein